MSFIITPFLFDLRPNPKLVVLGLSIQTHLRLFLRF